MANLTWREHARPIVWRVIQENAGKTEKEIRAALFDAYPYGQRKHHPYKIWLDEIKKQLISSKKPKNQEAS